MTQSSHNGGNGSINHDIASASSALAPTIMSADQAEFIRRAVSTFEGRAALADQAGVPMHELDSLFDASGRLLPVAFLETHEDTLLKLCLVDPQTGTRSDS